MKKFILLTMLSCLAAMTGFSQNIDQWQTEYFVKKNVKMFPASTLQDIYKSFFQSIYGPEHLVTDKEKVIGYIEYELQRDFNETYPIYEPCGVNGDFIRVNISAVKESYITKELLADCFIRSSETEHKIPLKEFHSMWQQIVNYIAKSDINFENFQEDSVFIENLIKKGEYAWVHSRKYHDEYLPHYRIIEKNIFYNEIYPLLKKEIYKK